MFTPESNAQLAQAGEEFYKMIEGLGNGFSYADVSQAFAAAMSSKEVVDEIRADKARAISGIAGNALVAYSKS